MKTRDIAILGGAGLLAYYLLNKNKAAAQSDAGTGIGGGVSSTGSFWDALNPLNWGNNIVNSGAEAARQAIQNVNPATQNIAKSLVPSVQPAATPAINPATYTGSGTSYYGPAIYSGGLKYVPTAASGAKLAGSYLIGQTSARQYTASMLGVPTSAINPNVSKLIVNPIKTNTNPFKYFKLK